MKTYKLRAQTIRSDGGRQWLAEVDAAELRRALAADPLDAPTTVHVNVSGDVLGTKEVVEEIVKAISQPSRRYHQRRQAVCTFAGPNKRRGNWRVTGRRSGDLYRSDRRLRQRRVRGERRTMRTEGFWRHQCTRSVVPGFVIGLWSAYCPDCGTGYTTINDRRRIGSRRIFLSDRRKG